MQLAKTLLDFLPSPASLSLKLKPLPQGRSCLPSKIQEILSYTFSERWVLANVTSLPKCSMDSQGLSYARSLASDSAYVTL